MYPGLLRKVWDVLSGDEVPAGTALGQVSFTHLSVSAEVWDLDSRPWLLRARCCGVCCVFPRWDPGMLSDVITWQHPWHGFQEMLTQNPNAASRLRSAVKRAVLGLPEEPKWMCSSVPHCSFCLSLAPSPGSLLCAMGLFFLGKLSRIPCNVCIPHSNCAARRRRIALCTRHSCLVPFLARNHFQE